MIRQTDLGPVGAAQPGRHGQRVEQRASGQRIAHELAVLVDMPPDDPGNWVFEIKFDGYRTMAHVEDGTVRLITRPPASRQAIGLSPTA